MAYFAKLNENNKVIKVEPVSNNVLLEEQLDENNNVIYVGVEQESKGVEFLRTLYKEPNAVWKQTSYNNNVRKNYACVNAEYREDLNAFIHPSPHASWVLNETTCKWEAPKPYPADGWAEGTNENGFTYSWNESVKNWARIGNRRWQ